MGWDKARCCCSLSVLIVLPVVLPVVLLFVPPVMLVLRSVACCLSPVVFGQSVFVFVSATEQVLVIPNLYQKIKLGSCTHDNDK